MDIIKGTEFPFISQQLLSMSNTLVVVKFKSAERQVCKMNFNWANYEFSNAYPHQTKTEPMDTLRIIYLKMSELCAQSQFSSSSPFSCGADQNKVTMISFFNERNVPFSFLFSGEQVSWFCSNVQHFNKDPFEGHPLKV